MVTRGKCIAVRRSLVLGMIAVLAMVGMACELLGTLTPAPTAGPAATATVTSAPSPTPMATAAPIATATPAPSLPPTATPTPTPAPAPTPVPAAADFSGTWISPEWGEMKLVQSGNEVSGTYTWDDGKIEGTIVDRQR